MTLPGFELLYSSVQSQLRSPQDAVVSAVHWNLINAGLKLSGVGENPTVSVSKKRYYFLFLVNIHFSKLANSRTKSIWFSYKNTTGYQKTMV